jgi:hypothetical protein
MLEAAAERGWTMTEAEWLSSDDPQPMLRFLGIPPRDPVGSRRAERKFHLFVSACISRVAHYLPPDLRKLSEIADTVCDYPPPPTDAAAAAGWAIRLAGCAPDRDTEQAVQARLLRDLFGDQFRPASVDPGWVAWNSDTIPKLALAIYDERRFADLPILADALEDAGCTDREILAHCRSQGPHVRGCWVVDLLLGKG